MHKKIAKCAVEIESAVHDYNYCQLDGGSITSRDLRKYYPDYQIAGKAIQQYRTNMTNYRVTEKIIYKSQLSIANLITEYCNCSSCVKSNHEEKVVHSAILRLRREKRMGK